jgi:hypothetical protein
LKFIFNGWNYVNLYQNINILLSGTKKKMHALIDGQPIRDEDQPIEDIKELVSYL